MEPSYKDVAVKKIINSSKEKVLKTLIYMEGMEAEHNINVKDIESKQREPV